MCSEFGGGVLWITVGHDLSWSAHPGHVVIKVWRGHVLGSAIRTPRRYRPFKSLAAFELCQKEFSQYLGGSTVGSAHQVEGKSREANCGRTIVFLQVARSVL